MIDAKTRVVLLGTGNPNPDPDRMGPCTAVVVGDKAYIVDFGPGLIRRAQAAFQQGITALEVRRLDTAFLTHLHSDHTMGYPDLMFTPWVMGRAGPLQVYGPPGLRSMTEHLLAAYEQDRKIRVCGLEPINAGSYGVDSHEIGPGLCYEDERVQVEAYEVNHGEGWLALSYKFTAADRTIVVSGDTAPHDPLVEHWAGCDVLVHEVYSDSGFARHKSNWQNYHSHMHTSATQLADIAARVAPKKLVLTHLMLWGSTEETLLTEIRRRYRGEVQSGRDLGCY